MDQPNGMLSRGRPISINLPLRNLSLPSVVGGVVHTPGTLIPGTIGGAPTPKASVTPTADSSAFPGNPRSPRTPGQPKTNTLRDREGNAVAEMLKRFHNLVTLAATPVEDGATKEVAAAQAFQMNAESDALVRGAEELLQLTRELKEMWLFGPLRGIKEGEGEGKMDEDSVKVGEMVEALLKKTSVGSDKTS
ncbi:hypothetical protein BDZ45DRAFT_681111 [Acephala macrosclerotiorum]|nr:hypothetical protein BDZ45DRAFT_681111 [Acephala macrosclerotiorum]